MFYPTVTDDGHVLQLDLHGASVVEALHLTRRAITEAHHRGRSMVRLIHGKSTSQRDPYANTIKNALYEEFDQKAYGNMVTAVSKLDGVALVSLTIPQWTDPNKITIFDLQ